MFIYPYLAASASVQGLKEALNAKIIRLEDSQFKGAANKPVINWGCSTIDNKEVLASNLLNKPEAVGQASNKHTLFNILVNTDTNIPEFTDDVSVAQQWVEEGATVVIREKLTGHSGQGIVLIEDSAQWEDYQEVNKAKLYVKYIPKREEFRVHVFRGIVVDVQKKAVQKDTKPINFKIRNHSNGFVFIRNDITVPEGVVEEAVKAVGYTNLDFGAVDVIYNEYRKKAYVLEINTAPGLEGATLTNYAKCFSDFFQLG